jgi:hypothetical protein
MCTFASKDGVATKSNPESNEGDDGNGELRKTDSEGVGGHVLEGRKREGRITAGYMYDGRKRLPAERGRRGDEVKTTDTDEDNTSNSTREQGPGSVMVNGVTLQSGGQGKLASVIVVVVVMGLQSRGLSMQDN